MGMTLDRFSAHPKTFWKIPIVDKSYSTFTYAVSGFGQWKWYGKILKTRFNRGLEKRRHDTREFLGQKHLRKWKWKWTSIGKTTDPFAKQFFVGCKLNVGASYTRERMLFNG
jgi:hypothetical protein